MPGPPDFNACLRPLLPSRVGEVDVFKVQTTHDNGQFKVYKLRITFCLQMESCCYSYSRYTSAKLTVNLPVLRPTIKELRTSSKGKATCHAAAREQALRAALQANKELLQSSACDICTIYFAATTHTDIVYLSYNIYNTYNNNNDNSNKKK